jgi:hypothetical protein
MSWEQTLDARRRASIRQSLENVASDPSCLHRPVQEPFKETQRKRDIQLAKPALHSANVPAVFNNSAVFLHHMVMMTS